MNIKGRFRIIGTNLDGSPIWSRFPRTRQEAIVENVAKYHPQIPCPIHGGNPIVFTITDIRGCCADYDSIDAWNEAVVIKGEPTDPTSAVTQGLNYYWSHPEKNKHCGHPGKVLLNGKCYFCAQDRQNAVTPRQAAAAKGDTWYTPAIGDECKKCGQLAERRVSNGACRGCEEIAKQNRPKEIWEEKPDMIISREMALGMGLKFYRTGKTCHNGHTAWRYISTGNCLQCMGR